MLTVKGAGLIAGNIELYILSVHAFVAVDAILLGVVPHRMVPPVEQRKRFGLIDRIAITVPRIFLDEPTGDIIDLAVPM